MKLFPSNALKLLLKYVIKSKTRENRHSRDRQPYYAAAANSNELCHDLMLPDPAPEMRGHRFARSPSHPPQSVVTDRQARFNEGETMHGKAVFPSSSNFESKSRFTYTVYAKPIPTGAVRCG